MAPKMVLTLSLALGQHIFMRRSLKCWPNFVVCVATALLFGCGGRADVTAPASGAKVAPLEVETVLLKHASIPVLIQMTGTLFGVEEVLLSAEVSGRLIEVGADLGDIVEPGVLVARIEPLDFELARDERARALTQQLATLGLAQLPEGDFDVDALPTVVRARLERENAIARFERSRSLADGRSAAISEQALADLRTTSDVAASDLDIARLEAGAALAEARTLKAQLDLAERRLALTALRAPPGSPGSADSKRLWAVAQRLAVAGDYAASGTALFRLVDTDPLVLRGSLPERHFGTLAIGQAAELSIDGQPQRVAGKVVRIAPSIDARNRSFAVEVRVENPEAKLAPGAFAVAQIVTGQRSALLVPERAVASFAGVHRVFVAEGDTAREVRVELGVRQEDRIELIGKLEPGWPLVLDPSLRLVNGTPLVVTDRASAIQGDP